MYKVIYADTLEKDLRKLDKSVVRKIINKIEKDLARNPQGLGKALTRKFKGYWRYRIGDFRVIYKISEKEILIIILRAGHRKDVYE